MGVKHIYKDHLDNEYNTLDELCEKYNITTARYYQNLKKGWSLEQVLTTPMKIMKKDHTGEEKKNNDGQLMRIIESPDTHHLKVLFVDSGRIKENVYYGDFVRGMIKDRPKADDRVGETALQNCGALATITKHLGDGKYEISLDDGRTFTAHYDRFRKGEIGRRRKGLTSFKEKTNIIGQSRMSLYGEEYTVIEKKDKRYIVQFCNGEIKEYSLPSIYKNDLKSNAYIKSQKITVVSSREKRSYVCEDHLGNKYANKTDMCKKYNVPKATVDDRLDKGWSLERALTTPNKSYIQKVVYHGKSWSISTLCRKHNITTGKLRTLMERGYSVDEIIDLRLTVHCIRCFDGKIYPSEKVMCKRYHTSQGNYRKRLEAGWSQEEALTFSFGPVYDHYGNEFSNYAEMCRHYNVNISTFRSRKFIHGWSLKESLLGQDVDNNIYVLGRTFTSLADVMKYFNVSSGPYYKFFNQGLSMEESILNIIIERYKSFVRDHLGNYYKTWQDMCDHYGIRLNTFQYRINSGMSLEEALTSPKQIYQWEIGYKFMTNCGLEAEFIGLVNGLKRIRFEDGTVVTAKNTAKPGHPNLRRNYGSNFMNFKTKRGRLADDGNVWYKCTCQICGQSFVETPQFMIAHHKFHIEQGEKP